MTQTLNQRASQFLGFATPTRKSASLNDQIAEALFKGDSPGHPFRGNQYSGGGGKSVSSQSGRAKVGDVVYAYEGEETKSTGTIDGGAPGTVTAVDNNGITLTPHESSGIDSPLRVAHDSYTVHPHMADAIAEGHGEYMSGRDGSAELAQVKNLSPAQKDAYVKGFTDETNNGEVDNAHEAGLSAARAIKKSASSSPIAKAVEALFKGDVPGHEFHGNQWTGGGGSVHTPASKLTGSIKSHLMSEHGLRADQIDSRHTSWQHADLHKEHSFTSDKADKLHSMLDKSVKMYEKMGDDPSQKEELAAMDHSQKIADTAASHGEALVGKDAFQNMVQDATSNVHDYVKEGKSDGTAENDARAAIQSAVNAQSAGEAAHHLAQLTAMADMWAEGNH